MLSIDLMKTAYQTLYDCIIINLFSEMSHMIKHSIIYSYKNFFSSKSCQDICYFPKSFWCVVTINAKGI